MEFGIGTYALGFAAGALSTLSPCVLPLVPLVVASAVGEHRWGGLALGTGLAFSFAVFGIFLATVGAAIGLDTETVRFIGSVLMIFFALCLLFPAAQAWLAARTGVLSNAGTAAIGKITIPGLRGQFLVGCLLGLVWSPCVGPTLGAATTLASQGQQLSEVSLLMGLFGVGAALPFMILGTVSRSRMVFARRRLMQAGSVGKPILGVLMLVVAMAILTRQDKVLEAWVLDHSPAWLTALTVRF